MFNVHNDNPVTNQAPAPVTDLSPRVVQLARAIDRLPAGTFEITIHKDDIRSRDWNIEIVRIERLQHFTISKYNPE